MTAADLPLLFGQVRDLTRRYMAGEQQSFDAFRELVSLLLNLTILKQPEGGVRLNYGPRGRDRAVLEGWVPDDLVPLTDGRYLRLSVTLHLVPTGQGRRLKVEKSLYQYQADQAGEQWVFRYDYVRTPPAPHPAAHLQVRGALTENCLPPDTPLERVHFPTHRVSLEAVIRLLADQFAVRCNEGDDVWRPVLDESERLFLEIAHPPLAGPA